VELMTVLGDLFATASECHRGCHAERYEQRPAQAWLAIVGAATTYSAISV
jgi:hypothetical protein